MSDVQDGKEEIQRIIYRFKFLADALTYLYAIVYLNEII